MTTAAEVWRLNCGSWPLAAERAWLEARGAAGEQPTELPCRCPRPCWCQGEDER